MSMKQPRTDFGKSNETGGRKSEEKRDGKFAEADKPRGNHEGETGEREPKGAYKPESTGERHAKMTGGVAMGKMDDIKGRESSHLGQHEGHTGEFNEGVHKGVVYEHKRVPHTSGDQKAPKMGDGEY